MASLSEALGFYENLIDQKYGKLRSLPDEIKQSKSFKEVTPEEFAQSCIILDLKLHQEFDLLWIA